MAYEVRKKDIKELKWLLTKLESKVFTEEDCEKLTTLSARFLYATSAMKFSDGYTLIP